MIYINENPEIDNGFNKIFKRDFRCSDCKFFEKRAPNNIDYQTFGYYYYCHDINDFYYDETITCSMFQLNNEIISKIKLNDRNINPETFIDPHPRHKLKNGMKIIL